MVCDECHVASEQKPLFMRGIVYTGKPQYVVISILCQECDEGKPGEMAKERIKMSDAP